MTQQNKMDFYNPPMAQLVTDEEMQQVNSRRRKNMFNVFVNSSFAPLSIYITSLEQPLTHGYLEHYLLTLSSMPQITATAISLSFIYETSKYILKI